MLGAAGCGGSRGEGGLLLGGCTGVGRTVGLQSVTAGSTENAVNVTRH